MATAPSPAIKFKVNTRPAPLYWPAYLSFFICSIFFLSRYQIDRQNQPIAEKINSITKKAIISIFRQANAQLVLVVCS